MYIFNVEFFEGIQINTGRNRRSLKTSHVYIYVDAGISMKFQNEILLFVYR